MTRGGKRRRSNGGGNDRSRSRSPVRRKKGASCNPWLCVTCDCAVEEDSRSVECGMCRQWCHKTCANLTDETFRVLQKSGDNMWWVCEKCRDSDRVEAGKSRLEVKVDNLMQMFTTLTARLLEVEQNRTDKVKEIDEKIEEKVEKKVNEVFEETREREKRKLNVVLVNISESDEETAEARKQDDLEKVAKIVSKVTDVTKADFSDPVRLGARQIGQNSRPRILRVTVKSEEVKKRVMTNASKLNEGVAEPKKRVYINHDRTVREREDFRKLREELERRKREEPDLVIKGGKIVKKRKEEGGKDRQDGDKENEHRH